MLTRETINWSELQKKFMEITIKSGGPSKSNSGSIVISHNGGNYDDDTCNIQVELGAYDIGDWPRHFYLSNKNNNLGFNSELEAYQAAFDMITIEAPKEIAKCEEE